MKNPFTSPMIVRLTSSEKGMAFPRVKDRKSTFFTKEEVEFLLHAATTHDKMVAALRFVVDREHLMFAECEDAEEILRVCKEALLAEEAK